SPCTNAQYQGGSVSVALAATDAGSGLSSTHYTLDGSDPTLSSPAYAGPFSVGSGTTTVKFRSWDATGNVEATKSQVIDVAGAPDSIPPTTTIACDGNPCSTSPYQGGTTVTLSATDNQGGTGVDKTYYTLDGSTPT